MLFIRCFLRDSQRSTRRNFLVTEVNPDADIEDYEPAWRQRSFCGLTKTSSLYSSRAGCLWRALDSPGVKGIFGTEGSGITAVHEWRVRFAYVRHSQGGSAYRFAPDLAAYFRSPWEHSGVPAIKRKPIQDLHSILKVAVGRFPPKKPALIPRAVG
jgi:hypothetical protein